MQKAGNFRTARRNTKQDATLTMRGYRRNIESQALLQIPVVGRLPDPPSRVGRRSGPPSPTGEPAGRRPLSADGLHVSPTARPAVSSDQSAHRAGHQPALPSSQGWLVSPLHPADADGGQRTAAPPPAQPTLHLAGGSAVDRQPS